MRAPTHVLAVAVSCFVLLFGWCGDVMAGATVTRRVYQEQFNLPIPADTSDSKGWMDDAIIDVPDHFLIRDLDVGVTIRHTSVFDLQLMLTHPSGSTILLNLYESYDDFFIGADYDSTLFDDEATLSIREGIAPFAGSYRPIDPLGAFDGQDAYGPWRLRIYDTAYGDVGYLETASLVFAVPAPNAITVPAPSAIALVVSGLGAVGIGGRRRLRRRPLAGLFQ